MFNDAKKLNPSDLLGKIVNIIDRDKESKKILSGDDVGETEINGKSAQKGKGFGNKDSMEHTLGGSDKSTSDLIQQMFVSSAMGQKPIDMKDIQRLVDQNTTTVNSKRDTRENTNKNNENPGDKDDIHSNFTTNDDVKTKKYM